MKAKSLPWTLLTTLAVSLLIIFGLHTAEAKKLTLHPLSARQVYRLLRSTGNEDALPEGRVVTQGLAAWTGFTLGITKGIGGALLFDLLTMNTTALLGTAGNTGGGTTGGSSGGETISQEICFDSRSARNLQEAAAIAQAYSRLDNNREDDKVRDSETPRLVKRNRRNKRGHDRRIRRGSSAAHVVDEARQVEPTVGTTTTTDLGTSTGPVGTGGGTDTSTTTSSEPPAINCIVINKPKP